MNKLRWAFALVLALVGLQISAANAAATLSLPPPAPPPVSELLRPAAGPPPLIAPSIDQRMKSKAGKKLRAKVGDKCAKKWLAKYSWWSSDVLLCGGIGIVAPGWGLVCGVGMFVGGEFIDYDKACD